MTPSTAEEESKKKAEEESTRIFEGAYQPLTEKDLLSASKEGALVTKESDIVL